MTVRAFNYEKQLIREIEKTPKEYLPALYQIVRLYRDSIELKPAAQSFAQGWKEALAGETQPLTELWKGIDVKEPD